jgi:hypothetical protein
LNVPDCRLFLRRKPARPTPPRLWQHPNVFKGKTHPDTDGVGGSQSIHARKPPSNGNACRRASDAM